MADSITVARPYAKALFELALEQQQVAAWSIMLTCLEQVIADPQAVDFIRNPASTPEQQCELLQAVLLKQHAMKGLPSVESFLLLLAENKRLLTLPSISTLFHQLQAEHEKTLDVEVMVYAPLTAAQEQQLIKQLSKRLQRQITLQVQVDQSLQGGAIIRAGHLVIDGSVATQIKKLSAVLAA